MLIVADPLQPMTSQSVHPRIQLLLNSSPLIIPYVKMVMSPKFESTTALALLQGIGFICGEETAVEILFRSLTFDREKTSSISHCSDQEANAQSLSDTEMAALITLFGSFSLVFPNLNVVRNSIKRFIDFLKSRTLSSRSFPTLITRLWSLLSLSQYRLQTEKSKEVIHSLEESDYLWALESQLVEQIDDLFEILMHSDELQYLSASKESSESFIISVAILSRVIHLIIEKFLKERPQLEAFTLLQKTIDALLLLMNEKSVFVFSSKLEQMIAISKTKHQTISHSLSTTKSIDRSDGWVNNRSIPPHENQQQKGGDKVLKNELLCQLLMQSASQILRHSSALFYIGSDLILDIIFSPHFSDGLIRHAIPNYLVPANCLLPPTPSLIRFSFVSQRKSDAIPLTISRHRVTQNVGSSDIDGGGGGGGGDEDEDDNEDEDENEDEDRKSNEQQKQINQREYLIAVSRSLMGLAQNRSSTLNDSEQNSLLEENQRKGSSLLSKRTNLLIHSGTGIEWLLQTKDIEFSSHLSKIFDDCLKDNIQLFLKLLSPTDRTLSLLQAFGATQRRQDYQEVDHNGHDDATVAAISFSQSQKFLRLLLKRLSPEDHSEDDEREEGEDEESITSVEEKESRQAQGPQGRRKNLSQLLPQHSFHPQVPRHVTEKAGWIRRFLSQNPIVIELLQMFGNWWRSLIRISDSSHSIDPLITDEEIGSYQRSIFDGTKKNNTTSIPLDRQQSTQKDIYQTHNERTMMMTAITAQPLFPTQYFDVCLSVVNTLAIEWTAEKCPLASHSPDLLALSEKISDLLTVMRWLPAPLCYCQSIFATLQPKQVATICVSFSRYLSCRGSVLSLTVAAKGATGTDEKEREREEGEAKGDEKEIPDPRDPYLCEPILHILRQNINLYGVLYGLFLPSATAKSLFVSSEHNGESLTSSMEDNSGGVDEEERRRWQRSREGQQEEQQEDDEDSALETSDPLLSDEIRSESEDGLEQQRTFENDVF